MRQQLIDAIHFAVMNMGRFFTSHNVIDFILSRPTLRITYDDELVNSGSRLRIRDKKHAEHYVNTQIGTYLRRNTKRLNIRFVGYVESTNIHETGPNEIGYYQRLDTNIVKRQRTK